MESLITTRRQYGETVEKAADRAAKEHGTKRVGAVANYAWSSTLWHAQAADGRLIRVLDN